jgi:glycosyltransferase involved in cell wall biosynthesis
MLKEAIDSVLNQSFKDFELLIIDDGSTDDTEKLIEEFKDPRIKYFQKNHSGVASTRNFGIKKAKSDWIALLDSDDRWYPKKLETQWNYLKKNPEVKICQTEDVWFRNGKRVNPKNIHKKQSGWIFSSCVDLCTVCCSTVIIHQEVFKTCGLFDENFPACEDYDLWLRISLEYPIYTIDKELAWKQGGHTDQLSQKYWGMDIFRVKALEKILKHPKISDDQAKIVEMNLKLRYDVIERGAHKYGRTLDETLNLNFKELEK